jgi:8-amino-7-oxononanoate synthase
VLDFTSALYLGLEHPSRSLLGWERLTLGKPAALEPPPGSREVEPELATLVGCERALLTTSTLHLFWDLLVILAGRDVSIFLDAGAYPIARWGAEHAAAAGIPVRTFRQHDPQALRAALESAGRRPIIVTDGFCPSCGTPAPLADYLGHAVDRGGLVVADDTQALGIFGHSPRPLAPYGKGGGGSLQHAELRDRRILMASSLAKAFGIPVAVLAGSNALVSEYERKSATRVHCSPPSAAVIAAAANALGINRRCGDALRFRLAQLVARLRRGLHTLNLMATGGLFPVQSLRLPKRIEASVLHKLLLDRGVQTLLHRGNDSAATRITFVVTARHTLGEIDQAVACLADALAYGPWREMERSKRQWQVN